MNTALTIFKQIAGIKFRLSPIAEESIPVLVYPCPETDEALDHITWIFFVLCIDGALQSCQQENHGDTSVKFKRNEKGTTVMQTLLIMMKYNFLFI